MKIDGVDMAGGYDTSMSVKLPNENSSVSDTSKSKDADKTVLSELKMPSEAEKKSLPVSEKFIIDTIEKANKAIEGARTEFRFSIHKQTHEISVKVLDKDTGDVIREIPPEKVLDMVAKMWEQAGILVDEKR